MGKGWRVVFCAGNYFRKFDRAEEAIREGEAAVMRKRPELADALQVLAQSGAWAT